MGGCPAPQEQTVMKQVKPDYFDRFACIKGDCRHSCCIGWEIDIDEASYARFQRVRGELGNKLKSVIKDGDDGPCFAMTADGRCPFLNGDGLCDLIIELGEDCLCQICDDHPRFRSFFSDREEIGLGLCCEAAARLILANPDRVCLLEEGCEELEDEEKELLVLRAELIKIMQDRSAPAEKRVQRMLDYAELEFAPDVLRWAGFLLTLEHLEEAWTQRVERLAAAEEIPQPETTEESENAFEQLMVYLLCRHLPMALEDDDLAGHILYCVLIWHVVRAMIAQAGFSMDEMVEICREYSAEIEYSDENIAAILDEMNA